MDNKYEAMLEAQRRQAKAVEILELAMEGYLHAKKKCEATREAYEASISSRTEAKVN